MYRWRPPVRCVVDILSVRQGNVVQENEVLLQGKVERESGELRAVYEVECMLVSWLWWVGQCEIDMEGVKQHRTGQLVLLKAERESIMKDLEASLRKCQEREREEE